MISRRRGRFLVLLVCAWFYGALLFLYPKSFRLRYSAELRRDFFGLSREALREGGILSVVRVWAHAFSALALTGIRQRRTTLPMERKVASALVMMVQVAVIAVIVAMVSIWQAPTPKTTKQAGEAPTYLATDWVWMAHTPDGKRVRVTGKHEGFFDIRPPGMPEKVEAIKNATRNHSVAEEVIQRLDLKMKPAELLNNLDIKTYKHKEPPDPDWPGYRQSTSVERTYKDTDPERAERILEMVGKVVFENSSSIGYHKASVTKNPINPPSPAPPPPPSNAPRNGLLTLAIGLALCFILKRRELKYALTNRGAIRDAMYYLWEKWVSGPQIVIPVRYQLGAQKRPTQLQKGRNRPEPT